MLRRFAGALLLFTLSSCALSHGRSREVGGGNEVASVPAPLVGDWIFTAPICDSFNRTVWVTLCPEGTAWLSDSNDLTLPGQWETFARQAMGIDDESVRFLRVAAGNAFESTTLALDPERDQLVWVERLGIETACGTVGSQGERGRPEWPVPLPAHPCP